MRHTWTRRGVLQAAGGLTALSLRARGASQPTSDVMVKISTYMAGARDRALPKEATEATKDHILDTFAAMVSGSELAPGKFAMGFARGHEGEKVATVAGSNVVCGAMEAAFANAMMAHADETDDSHAPSQSHPGCGIVPAALAVSEQLGIDGNRFLRAVAVGYDIGTRVTMALGVSAFQTETHISSHALASLFGGAAAAASAAGLSAAQMRWVLDYAAQQASGTKA